VHPGSKSPRNSNSSPRTVLNSIIATLGANQRQLPLNKLWPESDARKASRLRLAGSPNTGNSSPSEA
jgi:hypothetical protein